MMVGQRHGRFLDTGIEHALRAQYALEDDRDEGVGGDAEQTGVDDGPPHVLARVLLMRFCSGLDKISFVTLPASYSVERNGP